MKNKPALFRSPLLIAFLLLPFVFWGCTNDPPPFPITVPAFSGTYKITQWYAVDSATGEFHFLHDSLPLCQQAVLILLKNDSTYTHLHNDSSCSVIPPFAENGRWLVTGTGPVLKLDGTGFLITYADQKQIGFSYDSMYAGKAAHYLETLTRQ